jgi:hypothetical protein
MGHHAELVEDFIAAWQARDIERIVTFLHPAGQVVTTT